jgi:hypothetical protein
LGKLLVQSPNLIDLSILGQVHIHAETFVSELEKYPGNLPLQTLTLATRKTWLDDHIYRLINKCPGIKSIRLIPEAAIGFDVNEKNSFDSWFSQRINGITHQNSLVSTNEFIVYNAPTHETHY